MKQRLEDSERITLNLDAASVATLRALARHSGDNLSLAARRLIDDAKKAGLIQPANNQTWKGEHHA